ncbi:hypothetical protein NM688_g5952 [Phlebia brevispora]|uniref:Uncharacterized protein n=1 Tax=Phlebia brevispora TaxID=194682 RepID=A0ACC1SMB5_9APHY|nr:hypothetical protein NM688_g5952 [Phlebia brevispora]
MVDWMQQHPDVHVPGIIRSTDGSPMDEDALAGMYRIAQTGPASGRMTTVVEYLRLVQRYLIEYPNATLPGDHRHNAHYAGRLDSVPDVLAHFTSIATDGSTPADGRYDVVYDSTSVHRWIDAWAREVRVHYANNINQAEE